jgi:hypothetical protein
VIARHRVRLAVCALSAAVLTGLSACSAGQIAQTSQEVAAVSGSNVNCCIAPSGGPIALRDLLVAYNGLQGYPVGGSAPLVVRVFNNGPLTVKLVKVTAPNWARSVVLVGGSQPTPAPPTATASGTRAAAPTPPPAAAGQENFALSIPSTEYALLVPGQGQYLQLTGLTQALAPGMSVRLQFTFETVGASTDHPDYGGSVEVQVPVGVSGVPVPRPSPIAPVNEPEE